MQKKTASETMTAKLVTINFNEHIETAYRRMQKRRLRHLPVCDDNGEVVGMLSDRDVQRAMISEIRHEYRTPISSETVAFDPLARVRDYMSWPILTVEHSTELRVVAERMLAEKVSALLVQNGKAVVGIVTTDDLMKVLIDLLADPKSAAHWTLSSVIGSAVHRFDGIVI